MWNGSTALRLEQADAPVQKIDELSRGTMSVKKKKRKKKRKKEKKKREYHKGLRPTELMPSAPIRRSP